MYLDGCIVFIGIDNWNVEMIVGSIIHVACLTISIACFSGYLRNLFNGLLGMLLHIKIFRIWNDWVIDGSSANSVCFCRWLHLKSIYNDSVGQMRKISLEKIRVSDFSRHLRVVSVTDFNHCSVLSDLISISNQFAFLCWLSLLYQNYGIIVFHCFNIIDWNKLYKIIKGNWNFLDIYKKVFQISFWTVINALVCTVNLGF